MDETQFKIGDYVVCPGHGAGQVSNVEAKDIGGEIKSFYIIKIVANGMTVMIPTDSADGVRDLVTHREITGVFELLKTHDVEIDNSTWNRRHREYMNKIRTGSLLEIADVLRSLFLLKHSKSLSFGERRLLEQCKDLIAKEISLSSGSDENSISQEIDSCFS